MGSGSSHAVVQPRLDLHYGYSAVQGFRAYQEDRQTIHHPLSPTNKKQDRSTSYFACYDGHGGDWTSEYLSLHLHKFIAKQKEYTTPNKEAALMKGFLECDRALLAAAKLRQPSELSGSTAVVALIDKDYVYIASTGDSRCAICRTSGVEWLTTDHKPQDPEEYKRIVAAGGKVNKYAELGDRGLAVSRAFGDAYFKSNANLDESQQFIIVTPTVSKVKRGPEDQFLMLATDGLWNVMTHTAAAEFIQSERKRLRQAEQGEQEEEDENKGPATDRQRISERELLHELAAQLTQKALDLKSRDNVSAVIVDLSAGSRLDTNEFTVVQSNNRGSGHKHKGRSGGTQAGYKSPAKQRSGSVAVVMDPVTIDSKADSTVDA